MILKIVSGGQTGVDRAGLDAAIKTGFEHGGWCPKGRKAKDGPIDAKYLLQETPSENYAERTEWNVRDSQGTLIVNYSETLYPGGGSEQTKNFAEAHGRPCLVVVPGKASSLIAAKQWLVENNITVLNIAGPRETPEHPGTYDSAFEFLSKLFFDLKQTKETAPER